jgi:glucose-1-phosphate thymidylyltransferase
MEIATDLVGLIPAGGQALRLGNLPCSKEIYPLQLWSNTNDEPRVISEYLVKYYQLAGCSHIYFILREGKWDIPKYFGDGSRFNTNIGYLMMDLPYGTPFTLDQAYPFIKNKYVALGFPDVVIKPENAFEKLFTHIKNSEADVVLGLFPNDRPEKCDMVRLDEHGQVTEIVIKEKDQGLKYSWLIAVWSPKFTAFLHQYINKAKQNPKNGKIKTMQGYREIYVGDVFIEAMNNNLNVQSLTFSNGSGLDIETPEDLKDFISKKTKLPD